MALGGKKGPEYPVYKSHGEVRCRSCGRDLGAVPHQSYGFATAGWMKVCRPCQCCTWYSIAPSAESQEWTYQY